MQLAAAWLRNAYGWGYAFAAAGVGLIVGMIILFINLKRMLRKAISGPVQAEDMPLSKILGYVFLPAIITALIGLVCSKNDLRQHHHGNPGHDAFIFACSPIIAFYVSLWVKATGQDKRGSAPCCSYFPSASFSGQSIIKIPPGLTIWAKSTQTGLLRKQPRKITGAIFPWKWRTRPGWWIRWMNFSWMWKMTAVKWYKRWAPDPYFNNVPKDQWPNGKQVKLINTELFQFNPLFILLLTLIFVPLFDYLRKKERTQHRIQIGMAFLFPGLSALVMVFAIMSVPSIYGYKTAPAWLLGHLLRFTVSEIFLSPIGYHCFQTGSRCTPHCPDDGRLVPVYFHWW